MLKLTHLNQKQTALVLDGIKPSSPVFTQQERSQLNSSSAFCYANKSQARVHSWPRAAARHSPCWSCGRGWCFPGEVIPGGTGGRASCPAVVEGWRLGSWGRQGPAPACSHLLWQRNKDYDEKWLIPNKVTSTTFIHIVLWIFRVEKMNLSPAAETGSGQTAGLAPTTTNKAHTGSTTTHNSLLWASPFLTVVAQQRRMSALEESSLMGRRAKLLKPRSWGATDIRLFSISSSVSQSPSTVFHPHFMVSYSVCLAQNIPLRFSSASVCFLLPSPRPLSVSLSISLLPPRVILLLSVKPAQRFRPHRTRQ